MSPYLLIAQVGDFSQTNDDIPFGVFVILILAAICAVVIIGTITGIKHATRERELLHTERLKAIEKGFLLDEADEERRIRKGMFRLAYAIGVAVPIFAIIGATSAVINMELPAGGAAHIMPVFLIWTGAAAIGVAGVASGAWLAQAAVARFSPRRRDSPATSPYPRSYGPETSASA